MTKYTRIREKVKRTVSLSMAMLLSVSVMFPYLPLIQTNAAIIDDKTITLESAYGDFGGSHKLYCIDKGGLAVWGIADKGDRYRYNKPSEAEVPLSMEEQEYIFWGILTLQASRGDEKAGKAIAAIGKNAQAQGKEPITNPVTEEDLKALIYMSSVRKKYPWLETVAANTEEYLEMAGFLGRGGSSTQSGKKVPDIISSHTSPTMAYQISMTDVTIQFDGGGADADFIQKVPIEFSDDNGVSYSSTPTGGWTYTKTNTGIAFSNPNPMPPKALIRFITDGTEYASTGGVYSSKEDLFEQCLQIWECVSCSGTHGGGTPPSSPPWQHQRMVWLDLKTVPVEYFAALAGDPGIQENTTEITFNVFRHEEDFNATYNVQLYKYDYETGKPLQGARFVLYERFDDKGEIDRRRDGPVHIFEGGAPYAGYHKDNPVIWEGFRKIGTLNTDDNGRAAKTIEHSYHYDKTFCNGHPAPVFMAVPEPEEEEADPDNPDSGGGILNGEEIEAAKAANRAVAQVWLDCVADCEDQAGGAFDGVHFHWLMSDVDQGGIGSIASSGGDEGSTPDAGNTTEPDADAAYKQSGCYDDMQSTYDKFISLKYSYAFTEFKARDGYIRHDTHPEDAPVEIVTTDASENGANSFFTGEYSQKDVLSRSTEPYFLTERLSRPSEPVAGVARGATKAGPRRIPDFITQKTENFLQKIIEYASFGEPEGKTVEETETEAENEWESESEKEPETEKESNAETEPEGETEPTTEAEPTEETTEERQSTTEAGGEEETEEKREIEEPTAAVSSHVLPFIKAVSPFEFIDEVKVDSKEQQRQRKKRRRILNQASPSELASPSEAASAWFTSGFSFRNPERTAGINENTRAEGESLFTPAYEEGLASGSSGDGADTGRADNYSHCNNADGEGDAWRIYDHRTEGEFHINKKDLDLAVGENTRYSAYGDAQGDGTLEGAVYGLFAAEDIIHPDGKTGVVYKANNLTAIAVTDKTGDASFLVNTEAPGYFYDYAKGKIEKTADGWAVNAPGNLYTANKTFDDYTEDGQHERGYQDNEGNNGNCWIGRPLLMGAYYVKELSRSEGYELSIGNKQNDLTNKDQDLDVQAPQAGIGYAVIEGQLFADEQTSDNGQGAGPNELFFSGRSKDTQDMKYDIVLSNLSDNSAIYRKDVGTKQIQVDVGTGKFQKVLLTNPDGTPKYIKAENDYQYPKYNADGSLMTKEVPIDYVANFFRQVTVSRLDTGKVQEILNRADGTMTAAENQACLLASFDPAWLPFVKGKAEAALRRNGKATPRSQIPGGGYDYSSVYVGVFDRGVREGDTDSYGLSGVAPGSPAAYTVYGNPVEKVAIEKQKPDGTALTVGDAVLSVLDYYNRNPYYSYGGIDAVEEAGNSYVFTIYAGVSGAPENFMALGSDPENDSIIFHAVRYIPDNGAEPPRYIYVRYSNNPAHNAFGTYEAYKESASGSSVIGSATLMTDAEADGAGNLKSKVTKENVCYRTGELVRDSSQNPIQAFEYKEITITENKEIENIRWIEIPVAEQAGGTCVVRVDAAYTDSFGVFHTNAGRAQTMEFKAVLKEKQIILSVEDAALLGPGFIAGKPMNSASYYVYVKKARAKAYLDYLNSALVGDNTYIASMQLVYESQENIYQDGGTRTKPEQLYERAIRQKIKIGKDIQTSPDGTYAHNTNAESGHKDGFITGPGGERDAATKLPNFRFKVYLKSNLERLYRDNDGSIGWLDREGKDVLPEEYKKNYPVTAPFVSVQKLYTKVPHKLDSKTTGSVSNNVFNSAITASQELYSYGAGGLIADVQNPGYTRLLETVTCTMEDGAGKTRQAEQYNYEKFFDAIQTVNHDKWDRQENGSTSFKPFSFIRGLIFGTGGGEKEDIAKDNALRSDAVRQFAITWYLDSEVQKLQEDNGSGESQPAGGSESYQEEIYDGALQQAIEKAENYLKPFFAYDLDEIYSIAWDSGTDGGSDKDNTTLSADTLYQTDGNGTETSEDGYFYGVSKYLPYGTYVTVEQQPQDKELKDFYNKHYKIAKPKEIVLPAIYEPGGNETDPETLNADYEYQSSDTPEELQRKYFLRFNEEWAENHTDDLRKYVIRARNADGDFEVYKYGLEPDKLTGAIAYTGGTYAYSGFGIIQEKFDPYKNIYEAENAACDYRSNQTIEKYYHYGSVSEDAGVSAQVLYQHGAATDDNNPSGMYFKDGVKTMTGALTAYDGLYASALVPWTVTEPADPGAYVPDNFSGYADGKFRNTFYTSRLRIEKLDSDTGENILHDGAVFTLYSASREDTENSDGRVKFYEKDTMIIGSREFLEAMGARDITPVAKAALPWGAPYLGKYSGTVSSGTPVCLESEQILLKDVLGAKTGELRAFTTTGDISMSEEGKPNQRLFADQNVGYLATPQPLGAGCYVLAEIKAPAGYVRSKPVAIEIYSNEVAYYLDGNKDNRVVAAIHEDQIIRRDGNGEELLNPDGTRPTGNKPQDTGDTANVYFNNTPIRLQVSKVKSPETEVFYELNGRLEGSITQLKAAYGLENLELAYNASGKYLGYGWKKGYLDSLKQKQAAGEKIDILYGDGVFTGKARLTKIPETADDVNPYLPGAIMTLYDAVEVKLSGDSEDYKYEGVNVERDRYGNVKNIYIQKGYAGRQLKYVLDKTDTTGINENDYRKYTYHQQEDDKGAGVWSYKTVEREDTDILFYDLGSLDVLTKDKGILYSHNREGERIQVKNGEAIFAQKKGVSFLEIVSTDYENLEYSRNDRCFKRVPEGTKFYRLDGDGNRDSEVEPYTGLAFITEEITGKLLTWPVNISKDRHGNVIAREKIKTSRIAEINADTKDSYTIGTYESASNSLRKSVNPILNSHGHPVYYQRSGELYKKGRAIYDRDGDYVRYQYSDALKSYNDNAFRVNTNDGLRDTGPEPETDTDDKPLHHRQGEAYLIENTWTTGEQTPNDPFSTEMTAGQADMLKRIPAGTYIMEELKAPEGYVKTMPVGVVVNDTTGVQTARINDSTINGYFDKLDAPAAYEIKVLDRDHVLSDAETRIEGKGSYSYEHVRGAALALFKAKRISSDDLNAHPSGYYLEKAEDTPAVWNVLDDENRKVPFTARWITGEAPEYLEGIPEGQYILEETIAPPGYLPASIGLEIKARQGLQHFTLNNDHTKVEIFKYMEEDGRKYPIPNKHRAELALYEAVTDENGIVTENGVPGYQTDRLVETWMTDDCVGYKGFMEEYEKMFGEYGSGFSKLVWKDGETRKSAELVSGDKTDRGESVRQLWKTSEEKLAVIQVTKNLLKTGAFGYDYDYKFNYRKLSGSTVSYDTPDGNHRIDYLPLNGGSSSGKRKGYYVLVESKTPFGFAAAKPKAILVEETADIQLYGLKNAPRTIHVEKVSKNQGESSVKTSLKGAMLALYEAAPGGELIMDAAHLVDKWISGSEGIYTEEDEKKGLIPEGSFVGELRAHKIGPLAYGPYYLAELKAPAGYKRMEPMKFVITADSAQLVTAVNIPKKGIITIEKNDHDNNRKKLSGASFQVLNQDTGERFFLVTDENGIAVSEPIAVGMAGTSGIFNSYRFVIKEINPPEFYQLNLSAYEFQFEEDETKEELTFRLSVPNKLTEIFISKTDFSDDAFVKGAQLSIYEAKAENGRYKAVGEAVESWISDGMPHKIKGKLSAGCVYMLKEIKPPGGYNQTQPVIFTLSDDGRRILNVTNNLKLVSFKASEVFVDAIESVTVTGRQAREVKTRLTNLDTGEIIDIPFWQSGILTEADGLREGNRYEQKEITCYTDGNEMVSGRRIFRLYLSKDGTYHVSRAAAEKTMMQLLTEEGELIEEWKVENRENSGYEHTVLNPEYEEKQYIEAVSSNGRYGLGVLPGSVVTYEISYKNTTGSRADIRIKLNLDSQTEYMPANSSRGGRESKGAVIWDVKNVEQGEGGSLTAVVAVKEDAKGSILQKAEIGKETYECRNPVLVEGGLTLTSRIRGTESEKLEEQEFLYRVSFFDTEGEHLKGSFFYTGSREGQLKSGETISLKGGEFITLSGMPWGTRYQVKAKDEASGDVRGVTGKEGSTALFHYKKNDGSLREVFKKNSTYHLTETTVYTDATAQISGRLTFSLDENASVGGLDMKDHPTHVSVTKTDITGQKEIPGAHMAVEDSKGVMLEEWISAEEPHELVAVLNPGETYFLKEISPPDGYAYAKAVEFTVSEDGCIDQVQMEDKETKVEVSKLSAEDGRGLVGATLEIRDLSGKIMERWISDGDKHLIAGKLKAGETYILHEISPPPGYIRAKSLSFTVSETGIVDSLVLEDTPTKVLIEKLGATEEGTEHTGPLAGAVLEVRDSSGTVMERWVSSGKGHLITGKLIAGETYHLFEISPPSGYEPADPVSFTVSEEEEIITVSMTDLKIKESEDRHIPRLRIHKISGISLEALEGAEFTVFRLDGSVYATLVTGETGSAAIKCPEAGNYIVRETKPPFGYMLSEKEFAFTVFKGSWADINIQVKNWRQPDVWIIKEDEDTGERLAGASFWILDDKGSPVAEGVTDENGVFLFLPETAGSYTLVEKKAPKGYNINTSPLQFFISEKGEVRGRTVMQNSRKKRFGYITASYREPLLQMGNGRIPSSALLRRIPEMGDSSAIHPKTIVLLVMALCTALLWRRRK